ncbi:MAG: beta-galactosidase [Ruminococcaceae bacterium]|nr:beta-galactosidase [Oscillospiraceae bacterium]
MNVCPRPEHPTPMWERKNWVNLNGEWMFEIDQSKSGAERGLITADTLNGRITLPFCPESPLSGVGEKDFMYCVWYKKTVSLNDEELDGKRMLFHIGAADFETHVWINGKSAGLPHIGGCSPIEYDVTSLVHAGENVITVACFDDTRSPRQAGGKQSMRHVSYGCYYTRTTGIWQTVWYELVPESYVKYAKFLPDPNNASVAVQCELAGCGTLCAEVYYEGRLVGRAEKKALSVTGTLEIPLSEVHLWECGAGRLYDVVLRFGEDEVKSYFGLRTVEMRDGKFLLNGKSVFQRLVLDQGFYPDGIWTAPDEAALVRDIECSMSVGFNGARLHQKVFEPRFLYHADRLGYLVWGEYSSWGIDHSDIAHLSAFLPDWLSCVKRDLSHPAVIGWCPFNETWNVGEQQKRQDNAFLRIVYEETKRYDPARPCIDTSGNYHVVTDIYDVHDYEQEPAIFKEHYDALITEGTLFEKVRDGFRQHWSGEPVFMSEYGGIGIHIEVNNSEKAWSYGKATRSYEEFYARYKGLTDALLDNPRIMGFCYTQLTDVEQEQNGLFTYEGRQPKFDVKTLYDINTRHAAIED